MEEAVTTLFEILVALILILILLYLIGGGILWFHNRYTITFRIQKRHELSDWSRLPGGGMNDLSQDDLYLMMDNPVEDDKSASVRETISQIPDIFKNRRQTR